MAHKMKKQKTMKTILYIITITLSLSFTNLFAGNSETPVMGSAGSATEVPFVYQMAPNIPSVATFDELIPDEVNVTSFMIWALAPVTPPEADFTEDTHVIHNLAPSLPTEADFYDNL
jgi:hypothetical protein